MVNCDHCGKIFKYNCHLLRHLSSKTPCYSKRLPEFVDVNNKGDVINKRECYEVNDMKHKDFFKNEVQHGVDVCIDEQKIEEPVLCKPIEKSKKHECSICKKRFFNKKDWKSHESKCNGLDTLQCPTCHKYFCDSSSKSKHIKNVNCSPTPRGPHNQSVYLIIEREFVKSSENIFKLGKTRTMIHRAKKYPNGSNILVVLPCAECDETEKKLLDVFRNTFHPRKDIGSEYFEGDPMSMIKTFMDTVDVCF